MLVVVVQSWWMLNDIQINAMVEAGCLPHLGDEVVGALLQSDVKENRGFVRTCRHCTLSTRALRYDGFLAL